MQRIVLTGGPGAGKTRALELIRGQGYSTGEDAPRLIIRERKLAGLPPRPDALTFAQQVFDKEVEAYHSAKRSPSFFERGVVEAIASLLEADALTERRAEHLLSKYCYQAVFIFPPWKEIYRVDEERDHTFDHAVRVYEFTLQFYRRHGYEPIEVPRAGVAERAAFILNHLRDA
jgi:predicted ATPase